MRLMEPEDLFARGGEMGALMRSLDWSTTPIGPIASWPQSLKTSLSICLMSRFPILIWWGAELVMLYNDAYRPILGTSKHPQAMGQRGQECWPEIWPIIGPMLTGVLTTGEATWSNDQLLLLERYGFLEECYFTFSYSPILDETGQVGGVFTAVTETTEQMLGERRLQTLRELAAKTAAAKTAAIACGITAQTLASNRADLPFALLYLIEPSHKSAQLQGITGLAPGTIASPKRVDLALAHDRAGGWPFATVIQTGETLFLADLTTRFAGVSLPAALALILPITQTACGKPAGLLVAGISPRLRLDTAYRGFFELIAGQVATAIADARAAEAERQRVEALAAAEAAQTQVINILESMTDAFCTLDRGWRFTYLNREAAGILICSRNKLLGQQIWQVYPFLVQTEVYRQAQQARESGLPMSLEYYYPVCDRWYALRFYPSESGLAVYFQDISERKQGEAEQQQSEERFRQLAENIDAVFWITDLPEHKITYVSPAYQRLWGLNPTALYADRQVWIALIHPEDRDRVDQAFNDQALTGKFDQEYRILLPDGRQRWVRDRCFPLRDGSGRVYRIAGITEDISDRKLAEQEREQLLVRERLAREAAEAANRFKDEFLAVLSHELRSPLNPILGWAKLLQNRSFDPERTATALATIERNARVQMQLVEDLLDVARILRGKLSLKVAPVDLVLIIKAAIETMQTAATAKSIQVSTHLTPIQGLVGDETRLQQIIWNLVSNAIKFTPPGGRVELTLEQVQGQTLAEAGAARVGAWEPEPNSPLSPLPQNYAQITLSDTGRGIPPEFLPHVFDYFRQADASTTRTHGGLGLGLAIVRHLVELHGGCVSANSPGEGQGASFTVLLPLLLQGTAPAPPAQDPMVEPHLRGIQVLVVDDEPDNRDLLAIVLQQAGAEVFSAASTAEALAQLAQVRPDLLVSDIGMPGEDGYGLLQRLRRLPPDQGGQIPAIALTAYATLEDQQQALAAGFQEHLAKPIEPAVLLATVVRILGAEKL